MPTAEPDDVPLQSSVVDVETAGSSIPTAQSDNVLINTSVAVSVNVNTK